MEAVWSTLYKVKIRPGGSCIPHKVGDVEKDGGTHRRMSLVPCDVYIVGGISGVQISLSK